MVFVQALCAASTDLTLDTRGLAHVQILGNPGIEKAEGVKREI